VAHELHREEIAGLAASLFEWFRERRVPLRHRASATPGGERDQDEDWEQTQHSA